MHVAIFQDYPNHGISVCFEISSKIRITRVINVRSATNTRNYGNAVRQRYILL